MGLLLESVLDIDDIAQRVYTELLAKLGRATPYRWHG